MRVTVLAIGSRGDVQPFIAIAYRLHQTGYSVQMAANSDFEDLIRSYGLKFVCLGANTQDMINTPEGQKMIHSGSFIAGIRYYRKHARRQMAEVQQASWEACQGSDLLIYSGLQLWGASIAEKLNIPSYPVFLIPFYPTRNLPIAQGRIPDIPFLNPFFYHLLLQATWMLFRPAVNEFRSKTLGIFPLPSGYQHVFGKQQSRVLFAYSPHVLPLPEDWPSQAYITGYCFLPAPQDWQPTQELQEFLASGPVPIYVGFGSMADRNAVQKTQMVLEAIKKTGQRAIIHRGWGGLDTELLPSGIFMVDSVPHEWLFERVSMVVHHGGAGTTAAGLRAGVPSLLVPHFADQFFWGERVYKLGVGPRPIMQKELNTDRLANSINLAKEDVSIREKAASLGRMIRSEDGVGNIQRMIPKGESV
jgi:UDP:flavonoid glycosyltransferase YjiC (YdhE family)